MYQMIKGTYCLDGKTYDSFGIQCDEITICDISLNRESIEALVAVCSPYNKPLLGCGFE